MTAFYEAEIEWAAGRVARAAQQAAATVAGEPPRPQELVARNTRLWALFELGHPEHDPHLDRLPAMPLLAGAVAENEAFAALADGELEHAEALLGDAAGLWRGQVTRAELRASWGKAEVAYRRGDRSGATEVLRTVEARASRLGLVSVLARARRSLDRMRTTMRRTPREARVSPREQEVLRLVGAGLRTPEIATRLGLSRRTVDAHVRAAMGKLGAATRVEAAALARGARAGETPPILFDAESELLRLLADGGTVAGAAAALGISRRTATRRLEAVRRRIGVRTNAEAALLVRPVR
jgi:DNA-binding NarL/FixJ family response regulator